MLCARADGTFLERHFVLAANDTTGPIAGRQSGRLACSYLVHLTTASLGSSSSNNLVVFGTADDGLSSRAAATLLLPLPGRPAGRPAVQDPST